MKDLDIKARIKEIDELLLNENLYNSYIEKVEKKDIVLPDGLEKRIIIKIEEEAKKVKKKTKSFKEVKITGAKEDKKGLKDEENKKYFKVYSNKEKLYDILKIAACTMFAVGIWKFAPTFSNFNNLSNNENVEVAEKSESRIFKIAEKIDETSRFLISPMEIKEE